MKFRYFVPQCLFILQEFIRIECQRVFEPLGYPAHDPRAVTNVAKYDEFEESLLQNENVKEALEKKLFSGTEELHKLVLQKITDLKRKDKRKIHVS